MKYFPAPDIRDLALDIISRAGMDWIDTSRVGFVRSFGSKSVRTIARCHSLGKIWNTSLGIPVSYTIEVIAEQFDNLPGEEKVRTIIHELLHIPKSFGGGFRYHDFVRKREIDKWFKKYLQAGGTIP